MNFKNKAALIQDIIKNPEESNIFYALSQADMNLIDIPSQLFFNYAVAKYFCAQDITNLQEFDKFQDDEDFIFDLINTLKEKSPEILKYASKRVRAIDVIAENAIYQNGEAFKYIDEKFFKNEEMVEIAFATSNLTSDTAWKYVDQSLSSDKNFVLDLLKMNSQLYIQLSDTLKKDHDIIKQVIDKNIYKYLPEEQKDEPYYMSQAVCTSAHTIKYFPIHRLNNPDFMLPYLKKYPGAIQFCGNKVKANKEIALEIFRKKDSPNLFHIMSPKIRGDREVALIALKKDWNNAQFISDELKQDRQFFKEVLKTIDIKVFQYASELLKKDPQFMLEVGLNAPAVLRFVDENLKDCPYFLQKSITEVFEKVPTLGMPALFQIFKFTEKNRHAICIFGQYIMSRNQPNHTLSLKSLYSSLPESPEKKALTGNNCIQALNSMQLELKLSQELSSKPSSQKIKI